MSIHYNEKMHVMRCEDCGADAFTQEHMFKYFNTCMICLYKRVEQ